jgi:hypothetical protein
VWEPLPERAARTEQMALVAEVVDAERPRARPLADPAPAPTDPAPHVDDDGPPDDGQLRLL